MVRWSATRYSFEALAEDWAVGDLSRARYAMSAMPLGPQASFRCSCLEFQLKAGPFLGGLYVAIAWSRARGESKQYDRDHYQNVLYPLPSLPKVDARSVRKHVVKLVYCRSELIGMTGSRTARLGLVLVKTNRMCTTLRRGSPKKFA